MRASIQPGVVGAGVLCILVGAFLMVFRVWRAAGDSGSRSTGPAVPAVQTEDYNPPSRVWAIAGGGCLAVGFALVGIGVNRWSDQPRDGDPSRH
jgi:hypothetical protein